MEELVEVEFLEEIQVVLVVVQEVIIIVVHILNLVLEQLIKVLMELLEMALKHHLQKVVVVVEQEQPQVELMEVLELLQQ
ncbi:MAG: hypothetical protein EBZ22_11335 [Flavobacteriia bacterium]|nr:hypothetical protein [Flavobacteriia bacterium]